MKISIILPFRNAAPWIEETIVSITNQTHKDWELIAVNDHSEDETAILITKFEDSRIQVKANRGKGIIPALQTGLAQATGAYLTRMDADDLMPKNKLESLLSMVDGKRSIATGKVHYFSDKEVSYGYKKYEAWLNERCENNDHFNHIYRECFVASPNWLVATESIREDRIFEQLRYPEDYDMTFLWKKYEYQLSASLETTHLWREHPNRTSRNSDVYDQASFFQLKLDWFSQNQPGKTLGVFGTGIKGKRIVQQLKGSYEIHWYDHEYEKYRSPIKGITIEDPTTCTCDLLLIAVFPENKTRIENLVARLEYEFGKTVWYV
jgi:glycosyltransferase involved in cell wall biosynthesis